MNKQLTASYQMTNAITGSKHWYNVIKKKSGVTRNKIQEKFWKDINNFPAYVNGIFYISSDILITDYKGRLVDEISVTVPPVSNYENS